MRQTLLSWMLIFADFYGMVLVGTKDAAEQLNVSVRRIQAMIKQGILPATKVGRDWLIAQIELDRLRAGDRQPGRPWKRK